MRLWSLHPRYLDSQGLVALWREALLAQKVLAGKTKGYRHHPQLTRFREARDPMACIGAYLHHVAEEATAREYRFDRTKILKEPSRKSARLSVTLGQLKYESAHLLRKLARRDRKLFARWSGSRRFDPHPIFKAVSGGIQSWERPAP